MGPRSYFDGKVFNRVQVGSFECRCYVAGFEGPKWITDIYREVTGQHPPQTLVDVTNKKMERTRKEKKRTHYKERRKQAKYQKNSDSPSNDYGLDAVQPDLSPEELNKLCLEYRQRDKTAHPSAHETAVIMKLGSEARESRGSLMVQKSCQKLVHKRHRQTVTIHSQLSHRFYTAGYHFLLLQFQHSTVCFRNIVSAYEGPIIHGGRLSLAYSIQAVPSFSPHTSTRGGWTCIMLYNKNVGNEEYDCANESTLIEYIQAQPETHQNGRWWCSIVP